MKEFNKEIRTNGFTGNIDKIIDVNYNETQKLENEKAEFLNSLLRL